MSRFSWFTLTFLQNVQFPLVYIYNYTKCAVSSCLHLPLIDDVIMFSFPFIKNVQILLVYIDFSTKCPVSSYLHFPFSVKFLLI